MTTRPHQGGSAPPPAATQDAARVGRGFLALGSGEAIARIVAFGATVYLARRLGAGVYGVVALASAIMLYFQYLTDGGLDMLGVRDVAHDGDRLPGLLPSLFGARLRIAAVLTLVLVLTGLLVMPQPEGAVLAAYAFGLGSVALGTRWVHVGLERARTAALARVLAEGVAAVLIVWLVDSAGDVGNVPLAQITGEGLAAIFLLASLPALARLRTTRATGPAIPVLRRGWPLAAHALLGLLIFNADLFFIRIYHDRAAVGLYAAAYTLVSFFLNLGATYGLALLPALTRAAPDQRARQALYASAHAQVFAVALPVAVGGWLLAPGLIDLVFGEGYTRSGPALAILLWSIPAALFRSVAQAGLVARSRQADVLHAVAWAAGLNLGLNWLLIPRWGLAGAAVATLVTELVRTSLAVRFAARAGLGFTGPGRLARPAVAAAVMAGGLLLASAFPVWLTIPLGAGIYAVTMIVVGGIRLRAGAWPELRV